MNSTNPTDSTTNDPTTQQTCGFVAAASYPKLFPTLNSTLKVFATTATRRSQPLPRAQPRKLTIARSSMISSSPSKAKPPPMMPLWLTAEAKTQAIPSSSYGNATISVSLPLPSIITLSLPRPLKIFDLSLMLFTLTISVSNRPGL